jgi:hypothetical protein
MADQPPTRWKASGLTPVQLDRSPRCARRPHVHKTTASCMMQVSWEVFRNSRNSRNRRVRDKGQLIRTTIYILYLYNHI